MIKSLGWTTLANRRRDLRLTLMYKMVFSLVEVPTEQLLIPADTRTRANHEHKYKHISARTNSYKHSFFPRTIPFALSGHLICNFLVFTTPTITPPTSNMLLNIVLQAGTWLTNFWPHFVKTWRIATQSTSPWSSTQARTFHDVFVTNMHLIKNFPIDLHANDLRAARRWWILPLDAQRTTHVAFYDTTSFFCCVINKRSGHQECFDCTPRRTRTLDNHFNM